MLNMGVRQYISETTHQVHASVAAAQQTTTTANCENDHRQHPNQMKEFCVIVPITIYDYVHRMKRFF